MIQETNLINFSFKGKEIRIVLVDYLPHFVLKDLCQCLELDDAHKVANRLDDDERISIPVIDAVGRLQDTNVVNEFGLYNVILSCKKPEAKPFKRWVTHEVLPSIRKTGQYSLNQSQPYSKSVSNSQTLADLRDLLSEQQKIISTHTSSMKTTARILHQKSITIESLNNTISSMQRTTDSYSGVISRKNVQIQRLLKLIQRQREKLQGKQNFFSRLSVNPDLESNIRVLRTILESSIDGRKVSDLIAEVMEPLSSKISSERLAQFGIRVMIRSKDMKNLFENREWTLCIADTHSKLKQFFKVYPSQSCYYTWGKYISQLPGAFKIKNMRFADRCSRATAITVEQVLSLIKSN